MTDFWRSSGHGLLDRSNDGRLTLTPDFLRAYVNRPELRPVAESCEQERDLYSALMMDPQLEVNEGQLLALADPDAADNYRAFFALRQQLVKQPSIEDCYFELISNHAATTPALLLDQLAHVILRNMLEGCEDPLRIRAAEVLFRSQKVTLQDGNVLCADEEIVETNATTAGLGSLGQLLIAADTPPRSLELDILQENNAAIYWERSDRFDTVLDLTFGRPGLDGLCRILEAWVKHFLDIAVKIQPVQSIRDERWVWHSGLDPESTAILNDLYQGQEVSEDRLARLLALFRLEFADTSLMLPRVAGRPVYLGLAMTEDKVLKVKPQNLLFNLPLASAA